MRVKPPSNTRPPFAMLKDVSAGRVVELLNPDNNPNYYMVTKATELEAGVIVAVAGKVMLVNIETGRILLKPEHIKVSVLSATTDTYYYR